MWLQLDVAGGRFDCSQKRFVQKNILPKFHPDGIIFRFVAIPICVLRGLIIKCLWELHNTVQVIFRDILKLLFGQRLRCVCSPQNLLPSGSVTPQCLRSPPKLFLSSHYLITFSLSHLFYCSLAISSIQIHSITDNLPSDYSLMAWDRFGRFRLDHVYCIWDHPNWEACDQQ